MNRQEKAGVRRLAKEADAAKKKLIAAVKKALPRGTYIEIPRGRGFIRGTIVDHVGTPACPWDVMVKLASSGERYRVSTWSLFEA